MQFIYYNLERANNDDGNPLPSFCGEPFILKLYDNIEDNLKHFWNLLKEEYKISLLVKYIDVKRQTILISIINNNN